MATLLESIFTTDLASLQPAPLIDPAGPFVPPGGFALEDLHAAVHGLPPTASPECLGLHRNADIAKDLQEATALLEDLADAVTGSAVRKQADMRVEEQLVHQICADMASRLPQVRSCGSAGDLRWGDWPEAALPCRSQRLHPCTAAASLCRCCTAGGVPFAPCL